MEAPHPLYQMAGAEGTVSVMGLLKKVAADTVDDKATMSTIN